MRKLIALLLVFSSLAGVTVAQQKATGYVYNDGNGNGKKDAREKGIPHVAVSNGVEVVLTDEKGKYELPVTDNTILFVVKPSGWRVPVNADNLPQFYYIHKPKGSPVFKYKGVEPTGPLPKSVDFALIPQPENDNFKILVFGDPQVNDETEMGYYEHDIVSEVKGVKDVAFGLSMGDMVQEDLTQHQRYAAITAEAGIPWYNVMGNHDHNGDCGTDSLSQESFEAHFGPADFSFNYGKAHFIILNDNLFPGGKGLENGLRPYQLEFIKNDLRYVDTSLLVILAFHCPLNGMDGRHEAERRKYFGLLQRFPHVFNLAAHTHQLNQNFFTEKEGWNGVQPYHELDCGATCGNWYSGRVNDEGFLDGMMSNGTPRGYIYLNISGNGYTADYKVVGKPSDYHIRLYHRKVLSTVWWDRRGFVYANFFMGYKDSRVEYRIDDGAWKLMKYSVEADPYYLAQNVKWDETDTLFKGRRPTESADCKHLWKGPLPIAPGIGTHQIEVRATDMFGRTYTAKSSYRIEDPKK